MTNATKTTAQLTAEIRAEHAAYEASTTFKGYTLTDLRTIFTSIENKTNWKDRIVGIIRLADLDKARVAAEFYAGSPLTVLHEEPETFGPDRKCVVEGAGYYACVGA